MSIVKRGRDVLWQGFAAQAKVENAMELVEDKIRARFQVDYQRAAITSPYQLTQFEVQIFESRS